MDQMTQTVRRTGTGVMSPKHDYRPLQPKMSPRRRRN